jgi:hypothetical protein
MKNTTVTVDATRLMKKANKAIKAVRAFDKACKEFGNDPRDVVVSVLTESDHEDFVKRCAEATYGEPMLAEIRVAVSEKKYKHARNMMSDMAACFRKRAADTYRCAFTSAWGVSSVPDKDD